MKIGNIKQYNQDSIEIGELLKQKEELEAKLSILTNKIRKLVYKYDTINIDYTRR